MLEIAKVFFKLGWTAFGGPPVAFSMMEEEMVRRHKWISPQLFLQNLALVKILQGPTATQPAIQLGRHYRGRWAGLIAGFCFLLPSFFLVMLLGISFEFWKMGVAKDKFIMGMGLAALAVITHGLHRMFTVQVKSFEGYFVSISCGVIVFAWPGIEPVLITLSGFAGLILFYSRKKLFEASVLMLLVFVGIKAAIFSFGTGLAIVPLLQTQVVEKFHLITEKDFLEALTFGQVTPGPVVMSFSWMGYKAAGWAGALVATLFVFMPGFILCLFLLPLVEKKLNASSAMVSFYNWAIYAVLGAMAAVTLKLYFTHLQGPVEYTLLASALFLLFYKKVPGWFVIPLFGFIAVGLLYAVPILRI